MKRLGSRGLLVCTVIVSLAVALPATAVAGVKFTRVASIPGTGGQVYSCVRTANGILHLVYPTTVSPQQGITAETISPSGAIGSTTTAPITRCSPHSDPRQLRGRDARPGLRAWDHVAQCAIGCRVAGR
jgi:hypothetical protein